MSVCFSNECLAQRQKQLDSLLTASKNLPDGVEKIKTYYRLAWHYGLSQSHTDIVKKYADSIKMLSEKVDFEKGISWYHFYYGVSNRHEGNYSEALVHLNKSISLYSSLGDSASVANSLHQLGIIQSDFGNYDKALSIFHRMLDIYQMKSRPYGVSTALSNIGSIYAKTEKYDLAIESFGQALTLMDSLENNKPNQASAVSLLNLGSAYQQKNELTKARKYYEKALKVSQEIDVDWGIANGFESLGHIERELKDYDKALNYYLRALPIRERLSQKKRLGYCLKNIGYCYMKLEKYSLSQNYSNKSLLIAKEAELQPLMSSVYENLSELKAEQKDFREAYNYHRLFKIVDDSIYDKNSNDQINELQIKYETAKKDQEIALLNIENVIKEKEVERQDDIKKVILIGLFLTLLLAGLLIYALQQKLKNQKIIASKNEEIKISNLKKELGTLEMKALRAQMNPHFLFNCMNSINTMILRDDNANASKYLTKFSKLVRLMLENSENPKVTLQDELEMLNAYVALESIRFKGKIAYTLEVNEDIDKETTLIPSMVLQPFVENAIWHGLLHTSKKAGKLSIKVSEKKDFLHCSILDNGVGREAALKLHKKTKLKKKSMGIKITTDRLTLLTKEKIKEVVKIIDLKDNNNNALGTQVDISIPIS